MTVGAVDAPGVTEAGVSDPGGRTSRRGLDALTLQDVREVARRHRGVDGPDLWPLLCLSVGLQPSARHCTEDELEAILWQLARQPGAVGVSGSSLLIRLAAHRTWARSAADPRPGTTADDVVSHHQPGPPPLPREGR